MEFKKFKPRYSYEEIWWMDAAALDGGWMSPEEFQRLKKGPEIVLTRGWIIDETDTDIYYCSDVGPKGETNGRGQIPTKMVLERKVINVKATKPRQTSPATNKSTTGSGSPAPNSEPSKISSHSPVQTEGHKVPPT